MQSIYGGPVALPNDAQECNTLGNQWLQANRVADAVRAYDRAIALRADYVDPHFNRGNAMLRLQRHAEALACFDKAIALSPQLALAHYNRGTVLESLGRKSEAMDSYRAVLALEPQHTQAQFNLGNLYLGLKQFDAAVACMDRVIAHAPQVAQAHVARGSALLKTNCLREAIASFDQALAIDPEYADALSNRGASRLQLKEYDAAFADLDRAIRLNPQRAETLFHMGTLLSIYKRHEEALQQFQLAYRQNPNFSGLLSSIMGAKTAIGDWLNLDAGIERMEQAIVHGQIGVAPFTLLGLRDAPQLQLQAARLLVEADYPAQSSLGPIAARANHGKIRVGYYSADFHHHATTILMAELFELHDRERFEWFAFSFGPDAQDAMRQRVSAAFDHFLDVREQSDKEIAQLSRQLGIDIAVDLKGFTTDSRFGIFAHRCAPVQVSYIGYPGTTGAGYMDYIVADKTVIPPQEQRHFNEKVIYLPHSYQVNDTKRRIAERTFTREELGLPVKGFVFCCFNNNHKILPPTFDGWMRILGTIEDSVLWLLEDNPAVVRNLRREAQVRGIAAERLVFAPRMDLDLHLARHRQADLFLDTLPYNAHTTTSDALWAGLPVLTCAGQSFASRVAASLLQAAGLPELITHTQADYEARAIALARDSAQLRGLRDKLRLQTTTAPLFDAKLFARHLEQAYIKAYERTTQGLPPDVIEV